MKKLLAFVIVLGAAGFLVYRYVLTSATERSCERLARLCGKTAPVESCVRGMTQLSKSNKDAASRFDACMADAKSCAAGVGCGVGSGLSAAEFTVTLSAPSTASSTIDYRTIDGTAISSVPVGGSTSGPDYRETKGTLTFQPGEMSKVIDVPILAAMIGGLDKTFTVNILNPTGGPTELAILDRRA